MALDPERYVIGDDDGLLVEKVGPWAILRAVIAGPMGSSIAVTKFSFSK